MRPVIPLRLPPHAVFITEERKRTGKPFLLPNAACVTELTHILPSAVVRQRILLLDAALLCEMMRPIDPVEIAAKCSYVIANKQIETSNTAVSVTILTNHLPREAVTGQRGY